VIVDSLYCQVNGMLSAILHRQNIGVHHKSTFQLCHRCN